MDYVTLSNIAMYTVLGICFAISLCLPDNKPITAGDWVLCAVAAIFWPIALIIVGCYGIYHFMNEETETNF